jgi:hypothetical protein
MYGWSLPDRAVIIPTKTAPAHLAPGPLLCLPRLTKAMQNGTSGLRQLRVTTAAALSNRPPCS